MCGMAHRRNGWIDWVCRSWGSFDAQHGSSCFLPQIGKIERRFSSNQINVPMCQCAGEWLGFVPSQQDQCKSQKPSLSSKSVDICEICGGKIVRDLRPNLSLDEDWLPNAVRKNNSPVWHIETEVSSFPGSAIVLPCCSSELAFGRINLHCHDTFLPWLPFTKPCFVGL